RWWNYAGAAGAGNRSLGRLDRRDRVLQPFVELIGTVRLVAARDQITLVIHHQDLPVRPAGAVLAKIHDRPARAEVHSVAHATDQVPRADLERLFLLLTLHVL